MKPIAYDLFCGLISTPTRQECKCFCLSACDMLGRESKSCAAEYSPFFAKHHCDGTEVDERPPKRGIRGMIHNFSEGLGIFFAGAPEARRNMGGCGCIRSTYADAVCAIQPAFSWRPEESTYRSSTFGSKREGLFESASRIVRTVFLISLCQFVHRVEVFPLWLGT